jgi:hypothetical protein
VVIRKMSFSQTHRAPVGTAWNRGDDSFRLWPTKDRLPIRTWLGRGADDVECWLI